MAISTVISNFPTPPNSSTDTPTEFNAKADSFVNHQANTYVDEVNAWADEANTTKDEINNIVATLPDGAIDDTAPSDINTYSSNKIETLLAPYLHRNKFINGGFDVWQRGESILTNITNEFTADRWTVSNSNLSVTLDETDTTIGKAIRVSDQGNGIGNIKQPIELKDESEFAVGKTYTLSFWGWQSGGTSEWNYQIHFRDVSTETTNQVEVVANTPIGSPVVGWVKFEATFTIGVTQASTNKSMTVIIKPPTDSTIYKIAKAQLEEGSKASPFEVRPKGLELDLCKRFYEKSWPETTDPGTVQTSTAMNDVCVNSSAILQYIPCRFGVEKRGNPIITLWDTAGNIGKMSSGATNNIDATAISASRVGFVCQSSAVYTGTAGELNRVHYIADSEL